MYLECVQIEGQVAFCRDEDWWMLSKARSRRRAKFSRRHVCEWQASRCGTRRFHSDGGRAPLGLPQRRRRSRSRRTVSYFSAGCHYMRALITQRPTRRLYKKRKHWRVFAFTFFSLFYTFFHLCLHLILLLFVVAARTPSPPPCESSSNSIGSFHRKLLLFL